MGMAFNLYRLQQTDTRLAQARARAKLVQEELDDDAETQQARAKALAAREAGIRADNALRGAEFEAEATRIKIQQAESSLYGGRVGNPKELQDLQKDVESLKRHLFTLEDRQLEAMLAVEAAQTAEAASQAELRSALQTAELRTRDLRLEQARLNTEIGQLERERGAIADGIDAESLGEYTVLLSEKRGIAVAALSDDACAACGASLTPAQRQAVYLGAKPLHCPSCGRLLCAG